MDEGDEKGVDKARDGLVLFVMVAAVLLVYGLSVALGALAAWLVGR